ncbi:MAG TPA: serine hydrolase domain-containing protein [Pseudonocardiaceae bacterium]|nr:serine hydrolase domain-containing protein [Pseudonocardiaceae bacterium]
MSTQGLGNVTRLVQGYVDDQKYAGAISLVARHDQVVHFETYGNRDVERGKPVTPDTIFRIFSMTKPVASIGLMKLYEEGRFQLNDPVSDYIPEFADLKVFAGGTADDHEVRDPARPMTVRDLLMHTSGLGNFAGKNPIGELYRRAGLRGSDSEGTLADQVTKLARIPLLVDPGSRWIYGISTDLVGYLCEVLSGQRFDQYLRERILDPLGMVDTDFTVPADKVERLAANYGRQDGSPHYRLIDDPATSPYTRPSSYLSGSGGLVSTISDYLRFTRMLARGGELDGVRVLGSRTLRFMTANHLPNGQDLATMARNGGESQREGHGFGLGFGVLLDQTVAQTIGTAGEFFWGGAASTAFFVNPTEDLIMIFLTQLRPSASYPIRRQLRAAVYSSITD